MYASKRGGHISVAYCVLRSLWIAREFLVEKTLNFTGLSETIAQFKEMNLVFVSSFRFLFVFFLALCIAICFVSSYRWRVKKTFSKFRGWFVVDLVERRNMNGLSSRPEPSSDGIDSEFRSVSLRISDFRLTHSFQSIQSFIYISIKHCAWNGYSRLRNNNRNHNRETVESSNAAIVLSVSCHRLHTGHSINNRTGIPKWLTKSPMGANETCVNVSKPATKSSVCC